MKKYKLTITLRDDGSVTFFGRNKMEDEFSELELLGLFDLFKEEIRNGVDRVGDVENVVLGLDD